MGPSAHPCPPPPRTVYPARLLSPLSGPDPLCVKHPRAAGLGPAAQAPGGEGLSKLLIVGPGLRLNCFTLKTSSPHVRHHQDV